MDNRLTKRRLSDMLSYDWILIVLVIVAAIVVWELVYSISAVRLTSGQQFKYYFDEGLYSSNVSSFYSIAVGPEEDRTFSYDVLSVDTENLTSEYNVLSVRLSVYEGDIIFTDTVKAEESNVTRANTVIDGNSVYTLTHLLNDGENYLGFFLKEGQTDVYNYDNLDEEKIKANFLVRMKKDNRFRKEEQKAQGLELEKARIKRVCAELKKFRWLINEYSKTNPELFYRYTKYQQTLDTAEESNKANYQAVLDKEKAEGRENAIYGINMNALTGGKSASEFFKVNGKATAENVVMLAFDFYDVQEAELFDLQFETVFFINRMVSEFSNIYANANI